MNSLLAVEGVLRALKHIAVGRETTEVPRARGSFSFASIRTSSQLLRLQVLRVGRAAKLAAVKLRVSRAGRALLGLALGSSGKP